MGQNQTLTYTDMRALALHAKKEFPETEFFLCNDERMPHVTGEALFAFCTKAPGAPAIRDAHHIAILGPGSAAWITAYFSVISAGRVIVPLHDGMQKHELEECIRQADCDTLLYDSRHRETAEEMGRSVSGLRIIEIHDFLEMIERSDEQPLCDLLPEETAAMYFTSGTTGRPRCVTLTNRNMGSQVSALAEVLSLSEEAVGLSLLPLSHTFEMMTNVSIALHCGGTLYINESVRSVKKNLVEKHPTIIVAVPLVLQSLQKEIFSAAKKKGKLNELTRAVKLTEKLNAIGIDPSKSFFEEVRASLGGDLRTIICGGAPLDPGLVRFFRALGVEVLQGYGITECSPVISVNRPGKAVSGSVGKCLPCCEVSIIDGEICVRGDSVSPGYYNDPEATAENFKDGWFHTGDLGRMDRNGNLYFEGRAKNLIILANGENVSPEELEEKIHNADGVLDVMVYEKDGKIIAEMYADPEVIPDADAAWQIIRKVNRSNASYKQIADVVLRDKDFDKTVTNKIKRYNAERV